MSEVNQEQRTAKLFMNGRSQALRLPAAFRFEGCDSVFIRKDEETGDIIISRRPSSWDSFFELADACRDEFEGFLTDRDSVREQEKDLF